MFKCHPVPCGLSTPGPGIVDSLWHILEIRLDIAYPFNNMLANTSLFLLQFDHYPTVDDTDAHIDCGALLPGEILQEESHDCQLALSYLKMPVFGKLWFSNFKVMFTPNKEDPSFEQFNVRFTFNIFCVGVVSHPVSRL